MNWIASALAGNRSSILGEVERSLSGRAGSGLSRDELLDQAAWTLDTIAASPDAGMTPALLNGWKAAGSDCAERGLPAEELSVATAALKRAAWLVLSREVGAGAVDMPGLIEAMMDFEKVLEGCRLAAVRSFLAEKGPAEAACGERVEALYGLADALSTNGGVESFDGIAERIAGITGLPRASILLIREDGSLEPAASNYAGSLKLLEGAGEETLAALADVVAGSSHPVVLEGGAGDASVDGFLDAYETPLVLAVPMLTGDRLVGVILLDARHHGEFTDRQLDLAVACAGQAALAIEASTLLSEMETRLKQMAAIGIVARSLTTHLDPREQLDGLLRTAVSLMRAESGVVMLAEEMFGRLGTEATAGDASWADDEAFRRCAGRVFESSSAVSWSAGDGDEPFGKLPSPLTACVCAPLLVRDKAIGVISVASSRKGEAYGREDMDLFGNFTAQAAVALENTRLYDKLQDTYLGAIASLAAAIEARDPYTVGHSARVTQYAVAIAESMGLSTEEVEDLRLAGLLHDLGKIGVPDSILNKAGRLSDEEYQAIKMHPVLSMRIIEPLPHLGNIIPIIYHHHERYDGNGYMDGKVGTGIPLGARIIAVADSYEAMTSDRPYRKALSREEAVAELSRNAGTQFDPEVVEHFLALLERSATVA